MNSIQSFAPLSTLRSLMAAACLGLGLAASAAAAGASADDLKPFPNAGEGQTRYVLNLPSRPVETDYMVELIVGKTLPADCNRQWFIGNLNEETVPGWGYPYYTLVDVRGPMGTLMACSDSQRQPRFIRVQGDGFTVPYNSRLPLVVFVPSGFELRYRLWQASDETWEVSPAD